MESARIPTSRSGIRKESDELLMDHPLHCWSEISRFPLRQIGNPIISAT